jgi:hypothetical protein
MSGPRNREAFARGQALRAEICAMLEARPPLARPLTARAIRSRLACRPLPSLRTVQWHLQAIWDRADSLRPAQFIP